MNRAFLILLFAVALGCGASTPAPVTHFDTSGTQADTQALVVETLLVEGLTVDEAGVAPGVVRTQWTVDRAFDTGESWVYRYVVSIRDDQAPTKVIPAIDVRVCEPGQGVHLITGAIDGSMCNKARVVRRYEGMLVELSDKLKARMGTPAAEPAPAPATADGDELAAPSIASR